MSIVSSEHRQLNLENSFSSREGDEIPGITTFIYRLNRYRRPEEYIQWHTQDESTQISPKTHKLMETLHLDPTCTKEELVQIIQRMDSRLKDIEFAKEKLDQELTELHERREELADSLNRVDLKLKANEVTIKAAQDSVELALRRTLKYGRHTNDCAFIQASNSGRVLRSQESSICSCGWSGEKRSIERSLKLPDVTQETNQPIVEEEEEEINVRV